MSLSESDSIVVGVLAGKPAAPAQKPAQSAGISKPERPAAPAADVIDTAPSAGASSEANAVQPAAEKEQPVAPAASFGGGWGAALLQQNKAAAAAASAAVEAEIENAKGEYREESEGALQEAIVRCSPCKHQVIAADLNPCP